MAKLLAVRRVHPLHDFPSITVRVMRPTRPESKAPPITAAAIASSSKPILDFGPAADRGALHHP